MGILSRWRERAHRKRHQQRHQYGPITDNGDGTSSQVFPCGCAYVLDNNWPGHICSGWLCDRHQVQGEAE